MAEELRTICIHFDILLDRKRAPDSGVTGAFLPDEEWRLRRDVLARHLPDAVWNSLSPFMDTIHGTREIIARVEPGEPLPDDTLKKLIGAPELAADLHTSLTGQAPEDVSDLSS